MRANGSVVWSSLTRAVIVVAGAGLCSWLPDAQPVLASDLSQLGYSARLSNSGQIEVLVQLSPRFVGGPVERCIVFRFFDDCGVDPVECSAVVAFDEPRRPGIGTAIIPADDMCPVDLDQVFAATACDPLHTLRSVGEVEHVQDNLVVVFAGDPSGGGHWLVGGNLDAWDTNTTSDNADTINILDFGIFVSQYLETYANGNTYCDMPGPHADINGDAIVDAADLEIIIDNFLSQAGQVECSFLAYGTDSVTSISVDELVERGLGSLAVADVTGDGWVDYDDMELFRETILMR